LDEETDFPLTAPFSEASLQQLSVKLKVPIVNKEGLKLLVGASYRPETYDFSAIGSDFQPVFNYLNGRTLKSSGFDAILTKSWNEKFYSSFRFRLLYNGDYSGVINTDSRFAIYNFSGLFGVKKHDNKEWGVGLNFSQSFRRTLVLPFFLYNHTFNDKWGVELILPALMVARYNVSERSILLFGLRYNSSSYSIETDELMPQVFELNHSEARATLTLQQRFHPWLWFDANAGIQYNFSTDFDAKDNEMASFQVTPGIAPYFKLGIFVSPPNSFFK